jgi:hypothetical protein
MPGFYPGPGGSLFGQFNNFYVANELAGADGRAAVAGFHLRVSAVAGKFVHNWGLHVLGGTLVNAVAVPFVDVYLSAPFGSQNKAGIANPNIETALLYSRGAFHWWYGYEVYTPGFSYNKNDLVNVGQHNYASAPAAAITYLPHHGATEISSKVQYIDNYTNGATHYRSGNELVWEYAGMHNITKRLAAGGNGYYYQQTTDDRQNGASYLDGNHGRNVAFGPEIRYHFTHFVLALKYQKDFLAENRPVGNSIWLQLGVPLGHPGE